jgi:ATP-binding cassette subfamily B protein
MSWLRHFAHVPATIRMVFRSSPWLTLALGVLTVLSAAFPLGMAAAGKWIVDGVGAHDAAATARAVGAELALVVGLAATSRGSVLLWGLLGSRLSIEIHLRILGRAQELELRHFEDPAFYDRLTRARREASSRPLSVVTGAFGLAQNILGVLGTAGLLVSFSPWVVLLLLLAALPAAGAEMVFGQRLFKLRNWRAPETRRLNYLEYVLANDRHAKEVGLLGLGSLFLDRYRDLSWTFFRVDRALAVRRAGAVFGLSLLGTAAYYGSYGWMALSAAGGALTLGQLTFYVAVFRQGQQSFQQVLGSISSIYEDNLYMSNLFGFLDDPVPPAPEASPIAAPREERGIRFENVGFRYPGSERWTLRGVDLFLPAGRSVALVGHNGAGKSTMIKLLTGLYTPTEGAVLLDGQDVRSWDPVVLRRRFAVVFQDFVQYQLPVSENVGVGDVPHLDDRPRIGRAVEAGGASEVVAGLSKGLDQPLGRWFDEGVELSGGQWQKLALARSFVREEADVLILDEPTAALDAEAEHKVFERFRQLTTGRTSVLVSHRFPTVRMADHIAVLDGGRIVEEGTHEALLAAKGRYAGLFELQAAGYL